MDNDVYYGGDVSAYFCFLIERSQLDFVLQEYHHCHFRG